MTCLVECQDFSYITESLWIIDRFLIPRVRQKYSEVPEQAWRYSEKRSGLAPRWKCFFGNKNDITVFYSICCYLIYNPTGRCWTIKASYPHDQLSFALACTSSPWKSCSIVPTSISTLPLRTISTSGTSECFSPSKIASISSSVFPFVSTQKIACLD